MLIATQTFVYSDEHAGLSLITAGETRVSADHHLALERPDVWRVGKPRKNKLGTELRHGVGSVAMRAGATRTGNALAGHFSIFNTWCEIDSVFEGRFLESVAPGSFLRSFAEQTPKVLLEHGKDPGLGNRPLGSIEHLAEDDIGAAYRVALVDGIPDMVLDGLRRGLFGASFRFEVRREDVVRDPEPSERNPGGIPERTIREALVREFGPVTFAAYPTASATLQAA